MSLAVTGELSQWAEAAESQNHRMAGFERDLTDQFVPSPLHWAETPSPRPHLTWPQTLPVLGHSQLLWETYSSLITTAELCFFKERDPPHRVKASSECEYLWTSWERDKEGKWENSALSTPGDSRKVTAGSCRHFSKGLQVLLCNLNFWQASADVEVWVRRIMQVSKMDDWHQLSQDQWLESLLLHLACKTDMCRRLWNYKIEN